MTTHPHCPTPDTCGRPRHGLEPLPVRPSAGYCRTCGHILEGTDAPQLVGRWEGRLSPVQSEGGLWGLLIGDAVGVPYEFHPPTSLPPSPQIDLHPPHDFPRAHPLVPPGTWSDDGAQALVLLDTLVTHGEVDLAHFGNGLRRWLDEGHFAVGRSVFDVGIQTQTAIRRLRARMPPDQTGPSGERDNGNGALMRVFPLLMVPWSSSAALIDAAIAQSRPTHGHARSFVACAFYCLWVEAIARHGVNDAWSAAEDALRMHAPATGLPADEVDLVLHPEWRARAGGTGYVVDTLWSARIALEETTDFAGCIRRAIAFGHDTDTTAAVAGAAAGVLYGKDGIPADWREALRGRELLDPLLGRWWARMGVALAGTPGAGVDPGQPEACLPLATPARLT